MTDPPMADPITEQIQAVDWALDMPGGAPQLMVDALHARRSRRSRRRQIALAAVTSVGVVVLLAVVLGLPSFSRGSTPQVADYSHIPPITLARLHRAGYDVTPPTNSARISEQQAIRRACGAKSWATCGKPTAYLVNMKDNYPAGTEPKYRTYWLVAWAPRMVSMPSCGPVTNHRHPLGCYAYAVTFSWVNAETGALAESNELGVKNPPLPLPHGQSP